jgi:AcrR family transcriptional regulator
MRKVAQALGVVAMTLYTYVPGKAELLDLMLDAAYALMERAPTAGLPWRDRVAAVAAENRRLFERHPWAARVSTVRPLLGPGQMAKYEHELSALDGLGLSDVEVDASLTHLLSFVQAWARSAADARAAEADSALTDEQWWATNAPLLERVLDPAAYPLATRIGSAAGAAHGTAYEPGHAYEFGLERVLDGLAALIER